MSIETQIYLERNGGEPQQNDAIVWAIVSMTLLGVPVLGLIVYYTILGPQ